MRFLHMYDNNHTACFVVRVAYRPEEGQPRIQKYSHIRCPERSLRYDAIREGSYESLYLISFTIA